MARSRDRGGPPHEVRGLSEIVRQNSSAEIVARQIRRLMASGAFGFRPGEALANSELARSLGASRETIAKARQTLHLEGLLEHANGSRITRLAPILAILDSGRPIPGRKSPRDEECLEAQSHVMIEAAGQAAVAKRDERFQRLIRDFETMLVAETMDDYRILAATELRFRISVLRLWRNPALRAILLNGSDWLFGRLTISPQLLWTETEFRRAILDKDRLIYGAILRRDAEGARTAMGAYMDYFTIKYQDLKRHVEASY